MKLCGSNWNLKHLFEFYLCLFFQTFTFWRFFKYLFIFYILFPFGELH